MQVYLLSLSTTDLHRSGGGSMFDSTGSHVSGAERRVHVMMHMVELSCTSEVCM